MENRFETLGVSNAYKSLLEEKLVKEEFRKALEAFVKEADVENIEIPEECANDAIKAVEMAMRTIGAGFIALAKAIEEGAIKEEKIEETQSLMNEKKEAFNILKESFNIDSLEGEITLYNFQSRKKEEFEMDKNMKMGVAIVYHVLLNDKFIKKEYREGLREYLNGLDIEVRIPDPDIEEEEKARELLMILGSGFIALKRAIEQGAIRNKKMAKVEELMTEYMKAIDYITDKHDIDQFGGEATLYHFNDSKEKEEEETEMNVYQKFYCTGFIGMMIEMMEKDGIKNDNKLDAMMAMSRAADIDTFKSDKGLEEIEAEMSEPEEALANVCFMLGLSDALKNLHQNEMLKDEALPDVALRLMQANEALKENRETVNNSDLEPIELTRIKF